ncbi:MAG: hypothetical protein DYH06_21640 [Acidobacteria bacterium ACB2]|nr:hypothetical protein [Acidobacteria bacterium ACB2]
MRAGSSGRRLQQAERLDLAAPSAVERAARDYLVWCGRPQTEEMVTSASNRIRDLYSGRPLDREDLHVQLVVDELIEGMRR